MINFNLNERRTIRNQSIFSMDELRKHVGSDNVTVIEDINFEGVMFGEGLDLNFSGCLLSNVTIKGCFVTATQSIFDQCILGNNSLKFLDRSLFTGCSFQPASRFYEIDECQFYSTIVNQIEVHKHFSLQDSLFSNCIASWEIVNNESEQDIRISIFNTTVLNQFDKIKLCNTFDEFILAFK